MIDHLTARRSLAMALDFALDGSATGELSEHLRGCSACRAFDAYLRSDAAVLRDLDFGPVPVEVRANVAIAVERSGGALSRWFVLAGLGAILLALLGGGILGVGGGRQGFVDPGVPIHWQTNVVDLNARSFWIDANGQRFNGQDARVAVTSDPGNATYRTLEATWEEHGVEMRVNLYFDGDGADWWVREIRIYDGRPTPDWLTWEGAWFRTPVGAGWAGDLELSQGSDQLHLGGLLLRTTPANAVNVPNVGEPIPAPLVDPFGADGPLRCLGILQMSPDKADQLLRQLGYAVTWRLMNADGTVAADLDTPPDGTIQAPVSFGVKGELIIPVAKPGTGARPPEPVPADCPTNANEPVLVPVAPSPAG